MINPKLSFKLRSSDQTTNGLELWARIVDQNSRVQSEYFMISYEIYYISPNGKEVGEPKLKQYLIRDLKYQDWISTEAAQLIITAIINTIQYLYQDTEQVPDTLEIGSNN